MSDKDIDYVIMKNRVSFSDIFENPSLLEHPNVSTFLYLFNIQVMFFSDRKPISLEEAAHRIIEMAKEADHINVITARSSQV